MKPYTRWIVALCTLFTLNSVPTQAQIDYGQVAYIHLVILDPGGAVIDEGGPWAYDPYALILFPDVAAGFDRTLSVWTTDMDGVPTYTGRIEHVDILMENPFTGTATLSVIPEPDRIGIYYAVFGLELAGLPLEPVTASVVEVEVDIKPGTARNPFSWRSHGLLEVAIRGSAGLNVREIDPYSVTLAGVPMTRCQLKKAAGRWRGLSGQRPMDLILRFPSAAIAATIENPAGNVQVELVLSGQLRDGTAIQGRDTITLVGVPAKTPPSKGPTVKTVKVR